MLLGASGHFCKDATLLVTEWISRPTLLSAVFCFGLGLDSESFSFFSFTVLFFFGGVPSSSLSRQMTPSPLSVSDIDFCSESVDKLEELEFELDLHSDEDGDEPSMVTAVQGSAAGITGSVEAADRFCSSGCSSRVVDFHGVEVSLPISRRDIQVFKEKAVFKKPFVFLSIILAG